MYIKKIKGNFGVLKGEQINFDSGLNIIQRDNEWGKTTLISLIKVMFYGLNTSKRDRKDYLSEKTKYTNGSVFSGEMTINVDGRDVVVSRSRQNKASTFSAYFEDTQAKTDYKSSSFGEQVLEISEEAFCNSALIESDNRLISNSKELENLIIAMSTTGDVSTNFNTAMGILKAEKSSIDKSSGILNALKEQLYNIDMDILKVSFIEDELLKLSPIKKEISTFLEEKKSQYEKKYREISYAKLEIEERAKIIKKQSDDIIEELKKDLYDINDIKMVEKALNEYSEIADNEYSYRHKYNELSKKIEQDISEIKKEMEEEIAKNSKVSINKIPFSISIVFAISAFLSSFFEFNIGSFSKYAPILFFVITIISLALSFNKNRASERNNITEQHKKKIEQLTLELENSQKAQSEYANKIDVYMQQMIEQCKKIGGFETFTSIDVKNRVYFCYDILKRYNSAVDFRNNTKNDDDIYALEKVRKMDEETQILRVEYQKAQSEYENVNNEIIKYQTKAESLPPKNKLLHEKNIISSEIDSISSKLSSINIAIEALEEANINLTSRLSPEISEKASIYMAYLTDNKYDTVLLQKDLEAFCKDNDTYNLLDKLRLSTGTKEQLYFALRLAICDVLLKENTPIILDDPFVFYDDNRLKKALDLLSKIAKNRQILIFTCSNREKTYVNEI